MIKKKWLISKRFNEGCSFETAKRQSGSRGKTKAIGVEKLWADEVLVLKDFLLKRAMMI